MNSRYILTVESDNFHGELWVNNVPVGTVAPSENSPFVFPVNEFILEGENKIGVMLHAGPNPSTADKPWGADPKAKTYHGPATLALKFAKYTPEEIPFREHPPTLSSIDWSGEAVPNPSYQERKITLPKTFDPPPWVMANFLGTVEAGLRHEATDYLSYLYGLLAEKHFDTYIDLSRLRLGLLTKAYGIPLEPFLQQMLEALQTASKPPFHLEPFNPTTIDLRVVADGRMLDVNRVGRGPVFLYENPSDKNNAETFFFPVKIGKLGGKWTMLG